MKENYKSTTYGNIDGQVCTYFPVNAESREISTVAKLFPICRGELTHPLYPEEYDSSSEMWVELERPPNWTEL